MMWCSHCLDNCPTGRDTTNGTTCCAECGKVIAQDNYTEEASFVKGPGGESHLAGTLVRSIESSYSESHRRTLEKGNVVIYELMDKFGMTDVSHATAYYQMAVEKGFTKGRRTAQVAAACLYIACREKEKHFLLIDFSSHLSISVYELGAVYLPLCQLLSLMDHSFIQKPIDPSLFMHRFTNNLIKDKTDNKEVLKTSLHIVASMKRDWMQTGRKPSGICAAALYVATIAHGLKYSKSDIVKVIHICEATLTKRLIEFENTKSGCLTIEEFNQNAQEFQKEIQSCKQSCVDTAESGLRKVPCEHGGKDAQSGYGLCERCYLEFCGGLGGSDPPAFERAEMERLAKLSVEMDSDSTFDLEPHQEKSSGENEVSPVTEAEHKEKENEKENLTEPQNASATSGNLDMSDDAFKTFDNLKDMPATADESETLSDIDDAEVNGYLNNEEESRYKTIIWEEMNKEYVQEQAAKEAAAAAARKVFGESEASDDVRAAQELAAAAVANLREKRKQKRALEAKSATAAQTAAEATRQMLTKKRLSSKINYDVLDKLFDDNPVSSTKKNRTEDHPDSNVTGQKLGKEENKSDDNMADEHEGGEEEEEEEEVMEEDDYGTECCEWPFDNEQEMSNSEHGDLDEYD